MLPSGQPQRRLIVNSQGRITRTKSQQQVQLAQLRQRRPVRNGKLHPSSSSLLTSTRRSGGTNRIINPFRLLNLLVGQAPPIGAELKRSFQLAALFSSLAAIGFLWSTLLAASYWESLTFQAFDRLVSEALSSSASEGSQLRLDQNKWNYSVSGLAIYNGNYEDPAVTVSLPEARKRRVRAEQVNGLVLQQVPIVTDNSQSMEERRGHVEIEKEEGFCKGGGVHNSGQWQIANIMASVWSMCFQGTSEMQNNIISCVIIVYLCTLASLLVGGLALLLRNVPAAMVTTVLHVNAGFFVIFANFIHHMKVRRLQNDWGPCYPLCAVPEEINWPDHVTVRSHWPLGLSWTASALFLLAALSWMAVTRLMTKENSTTLV